MIQDENSSFSKKVKVVFRETLPGALHQKFSWACPLGPMLIFYFFALVLFFAFRIALCINYFDRVSEVKHYLLIFPLGVQIDTLILSYLLLPVFLFLLLLPEQAVKKWGWMIGSYCAFLTAVILFCEIATFPFMAEFDTRPDRLFIEHIVQVREVFGMVLKGYGMTVLIGIPGLLLVSGVVGIFFQKLLATNGHSSYLRKSLLFIVFSPLLLMGTRSGFRDRPANITDFAFSKSHLANQLALNTTYSLAYDYLSQKREEKGMGKGYGTMVPSEIVSRVQKVALIPEEACTDPSIPFLHFQRSPFSEEHPRNLVIILEESLGAEYVGCLGGLPLTPNIDRLSGTGLLFTRLYATGTRTVRAIEALLSGFLPTPGKSIVKLGLARRNFFTIAELLRRKGYSTEFIYGGDGHFDNMSVFFTGNGFQKIYDEKDFEHPVFKGNWGVSDEDLFTKANQIFKSHGDTPFFALILTTSNHDPFEFPDGRIELYEQPKMTRHNAMKYADYAVGRFFEMAPKEPYYTNTVFFIVADHSTRLSGEDLIPIEKFRVPGLIIGPHLTPGVYEKITSQVDMLPTLMDLIGISAEYPHAGRHLLTLPEAVPGRAVMQYGRAHAFMYGDQVVIQQSGNEPLLFTYQEGKLIQAELAPELAKDALAHALLPSYLYYNLLHHLPD